MSKRKISLLLLLSASYMTAIGLNCIPNVARVGPDLQIASGQTILLPTAQ